MHASSCHLLYPELWDAGRRLHHIPKTTDTAMSIFQGQYAKQSCWTAPAFAHPPHLSMFHNTAT